MEKISIWKKIRLFRDYWKLVKSNYDIITDKSNKLNLRVDNIKRIYTVYTCPDDVKQYGYDLANKYIKDYISKVDTLFINIGLSQYVGVREIKQLIEHSELDFLIVFGYDGFDNSKFFKNIIIYSLILLISIFTVLYLFFI